LVFDCERASELLPFRRADGSVNLISPNRARAEHTAADWGEQLKEMIRPSNCPKPDFEFKRYDPKTGDVYAGSGEFLYNVHEIQAETEPTE